MESKGYRIYWPRKCSITVEQNVIFNQDDTNTHDDTAIIYKGEKEKVIQNSQKNVKDIENPENEEPEDQQTQEKQLEPHQSPKSTNTITFPTSKEPQNNLDPEPQDNNQLSYQWYGRGQ